MAKSIKFRPDRSFDSFTSRKESTRHYHIDRFNKRTYEPIHKRKGHYVKNLLLTHNDTFNGTLCCHQHVMN